MKHYPHFSTSSSNVSRALKTVGLLTALAAGAASVHAELIAYEGFVYEEGTLDYDLTFQSLLVGPEADVGTGWGTPWQFRSNFDGKGSNNDDGSDLVPGSLSYKNLKTSGNHVLLSGEKGSLELGRGFATPIEGAAGTHTYISFLARRVGPQADPTSTVYDPDGYPWGSNLYPRSAAIRFFTNTGGWDEDLSVGRFSNRSTDVWSLYGSMSDVVTDVPFGMSDHVNFIVVRIDHLGDETVPDNLYLWVDPNLSSGENLDTADASIIGQYNGEAPIDFSDITFVSPFAGNQQLVDDVVYRPHAELEFDELRVGTTWDDVTPVDDTIPPEPSEVELRFNDANPNMVEVYGAAGENIKLQGSTNMTDWTDIQSFVGEGAWKSFDISTYVENNYFFRAVNSGK